MPSVNVFSQRYYEVLQPGEIERRAAVPPTVVTGVASLPTEVACARLSDELNRMYVVTETCRRIIAAECERALAHALRTYEDNRAVLRFGYEFPSLDKLPEPYTPTFLSGPAGVGKTALRRALGRVLAGNTVHAIDPSHFQVPLIDFVALTVRGQRSAAESCGNWQALRLPLASAGYRSGAWLKSVRAGCEYAVPAFSQLTKCSR